MSFPSLGRSFRQSNSCTQTFIRRTPRYVAQNSFSYLHIHLHRQRQELAGWPNEIIEIWMKMCECRPGPARLKVLSSTTTFDWTFCGTPSTTTPCTERLPVRLRVRDILGAVKYYLLGLRAGEGVCGDHMAPSLFVYTLEHAHPSCPAPVRTHCTV